MSPLVVLPSSLASGSIKLGQLIVDPIHTDLPSFTPSSQTVPIKSISESKYQTTIAHDEYNRFLRTTSEHTRLPPGTLFQLSAESSSRSTISEPRSAFDALRHDSSAHTFFRKVALQRQQLYYVAGLQTLKNPSLQHPDIASATSNPIHLPSHVRRVDSASSLESSTNNTTQKINVPESIFAVDLLKVKCRVGAPSEPHTVEDVDYEWTYHALEDETQLSIGLGKAVDAEEFRAIAGIVPDEDFTDESWESQGSDDDDEGMGGF